MDLKQLKYFTRIVELESITAAAQSLFVAQPSLSQHVANLEAELGGKLLDRGPHGARPTPAGETLYNYAKSILRQVQDATVAVKQEANSPVGHVSLGLPTSTSRMIAIKLIENLSRAHPQISIEIIEGSTSQLADMIARQRLDLAIAVDIQETVRYDIQPLLVEQLLLVFPSHVELPSPIDLEAVCAHPLILPSFPNSVRVKMESACNSRDMSYCVVAESAAASVMAGAARAGLGWTVLPWSALVDERGIRFVEIDDPAFYRTLFLCASKLAASNPAASMVSEMLIDLMLDQVERSEWRFARAIGR